MRQVALLSLAALLLVASGCKSNCRLLAEKLCDCTTNTTDKTNCLSRAASQEANNPPTATDEARCEALAPGCDCRLVDTQAGKERCGLAVGPDAGT